MDLLRTFIAINLSEPIIKSLQDLINDLQGRLKNQPLKWVSPHHIHLTLKFLGDTPESSLEPLTKGLSVLGEKYSAFEINFTELGCFPNLRRPRVIWVGGYAPTELGALAQSIDQLTSHLRFASESRPFSPHLTLARLSQHATSQEAAVIGNLVGAINIEPLGMLRVMEFSLIKSNLRPQGPIYTNLAVITLLGNEVTHHF